MRASSIITVALFAVFLCVVLVWLANQRTASDVAERTLMVAQLRHAIGLFIAGAAALSLLLRALAGDPPGRMVALVLTLLAGILLIEPHWSIALVLAGVTLGVALCAWLPTPRRRMLNAPPAHDPPAL